MPPREGTVETCKVGRVCLLLLACVGTAGTARAQSETGLVDWYFAAAYGTGVYQVGDKQAALFRVTPSYTVKQPDESGPGLRLLFPATVGVYDFDLSEIFEEDLVDQVGMASILPGLEYLISVRSDTMLKPFVQVGYGTEFSTNGSALLYAAGARTLSKWERGRTEYLLGTELQVAGYQTNDDVSSTLSRFGLGGSVVRWPGWSLWDRNLNYSGYLIYYRYGNTLDFFLGSDEQATTQSLENQVEIGMTLGVDPAFDALGFSLDRLGLGLIFGENLQGIKLATDFPF